MNSPTSNTGAWIFVSHSHRDLEKVREIRNYLEGKGANPLLFFLKCLDDDDPRLPELIADEIRARNFFVICDSPNSKASKYVPKEAALIRSEKPSETIAVIDLNRDITPQLDEFAKKAATSVEQSPVSIGHTQPPEPQLSKLDRLLKRATVFLSYSRHDREIAARIGDALRNQDYRVWTDADLRPGEDWAKAIGSAIDHAVAEGFVLLLLSEASLKSQYCQQESFYALEKAAASRSSNVVPVVISNLQAIKESLPPSLMFSLGCIQWFDLTTGPIDERVEELIRNLKTREME